MLPFDDHNDSQPGCIFSQLLHNYSKEASTKENQEAFKCTMIDFCEELNQTPCHKSSGEWVWADDQFKEENQQEEAQDDFKHEANTQDHFELKRVQSLRMEQEDKVTMFIRKDSIGCNEA